MIRRTLLYPLALLLAVGFALTLATWACPAEIPARAAQYRAVLIREARAVWGLDAPAATFAAQIHQESAWRHDAVSRAGAQGLAQFMPRTAAWLPSVAPETGEPLPFNPGWSLRAVVVYDKWLWDRIEAASACDRWAMTLSAYNGGLGWLRRDQALAAEYGLDPARWEHVRLVNAGRSAASYEENRGYPARILGRWTPVYRSAGWGKGACDVE